MGSRIFKDETCIITPITEINSWDQGEGTPFTIKGYIQIAPGKEDPALAEALQADIKIFYDSAAAPSGSANIKTGDKITYKNLEYSVEAVLDRSGLGVGIDRVIYGSKEG